MRKPYRVPLLSGGTDLISRHRAADFIFHLLVQVQMKDFRFSYKFKMACKEDVLKLCPNIKKKYVAFN